MLARYRYRAYPTPGQEMILARTFGCARVVFNDALRVRDTAHTAGEKISDTEVQRRVITLAKLAPEREWLSEVASVALVQACQDARRAYRNWFDSMSGKRKGRKVGHPRFRSRKDRRQAVRLTRNGFALHGDRLYVAKVGGVKVKWSRDLPSAPSSVTVIREADGRYYVSFVVEVAAAPLAATSSDVGIDLGLSVLAATSGGELIANPRHLRARERRLARSQRAMARKVKGSANREKARVRAAVQHRKVRDARADHLHKTALRLVRDNQAVYVEDLAVSGLARTRLAKSVHDAGWGTLVRLLEEKAERYGRQVVKVGRWFPSSQLCSACGVKDGPKPLSVREWTCGGCGTVHDRDVNAARNIRLEGRKVAAGQADTLNACRGTVRPGSPRLDPVKQEPAGARHEPRGRNPRRSRQGGCQAPGKDTPWWLCPNEPRCPHASVFHDVEDYEDPLPRCCAEGCDCGKKPAPVTHLGPPEGGTCPCCGKTPFELPGTDRITEDPSRVTCAAETILAP